LEFLVELHWGRERSPTGCGKVDRTALPTFPQPLLLPPLRTRAALFGAPVISMLDGISYYSVPGHPVIPKENYQDSASYRTPKVQYIQPAFPLS
jgi:hypothetical protein